MPERRDSELKDLKTKALAESVFRIVEELTRKIGRERNALSRDGLMKQVAAQLEKIRRYAVGPDQKKITPATAFRLNGEYMMQANQLEETVLRIEAEESPDTKGLDILKEAFMPISRNKLVEFQPRLSKELSALHEVDEARGKMTHPAWTIFYYEAGMKHLALPQFNADEWYGEVMSQRSPLMRKLVLPVVMVDLLKQAAREGAQPMPNKEQYMANRHRLLNALDELIELWDSDMPPVADKYRAMKEALDHELMTLSLYYRYQPQE